MTKEQIKTALSLCFQHVVQKYAFEQVIEETRQLILYEFIDRCAEFGHGVGAELLTKEGMLVGLEFIHESGLEGVLTIRISVEHD